MIHLIGWFWRHGPYQELFGLRGPKRWPFLFWLSYFHFYYFLSPWWQESLYGKFQMVVCVTYCMAGLALLAMCMSLIQEGLMIKVLFLDSIFIGPKSDHWQPLSRTLSLTNSLDCSLLFSRLDRCDLGVWRFIVTASFCYIMFFFSFDFQLWKELSQPLQSIKKFFFFKSS